MQRGSLFLATAAVLLVGLSCATPARAGSTIVTVNAALLNFAPPGDPNQTVSTVDVTFNSYTEPYLNNSLTLELPPSYRGSTISTSGATVVVTPSASANAGYQAFGEAFVEFSFIVPVSITVAEAEVGVPSNKSTFNTSSGTELGSVMLSFNSVPEPASWSMLGVGMAGFFAFRRIFRRRAAV